MINNDPQPAASSLPLNRVRVLDLSRILPGPYSTRILADFGAQVVKIEPPGGGDWLRLAPPLVDGTGILFQALNQGKQSLTLNLKSDEGQTILLRLVETADVLLESFRPGVMERLGVGYERLAEANSRLVYCSLSGYGQDGPYRERAGHDLNYIGLTGLLDLTGSREGSPVIPGVPIADLSGALWAAFGILLALPAREQTGQGQRVDGSLLGGALACMPMAVSHSLGGQPVKRGGSTLTGGLVCYNVYETADGEHMALGALEPHFLQAFCVAAGREDWLDRQNDVDQASLIAELAALFRTQPRAYWTAHFAAHDCCCEPVLSLDEVFTHAQVVHRGLLRDGRLATPLARQGVPLVLAPELGEHTAEILAELGYTPENVEDLQQRGVV